MTPKARFRSVLFLELNEADDHFLEKFCGEGKLPAFARVLSEGAKTRTCIPGWDPDEDRAWRHISPWIVWPSIYTGLTAQQHGIVAFGQDNQALKGRCVWDVLAAHDLSTGVFGCLHSHPPRNEATARFYLPESLANDAACFPHSLGPLQEFFVTGARNYSESFLSGSSRMLGLLARTRRAGIRRRSLARTVAQVPLELLRGERQIPERAMLHSHLSWDAFRALYQAHKPRYAALHLNHIAYMQHRYWRAAEPHRFSETLGPADAEFYDSTQDRGRSETAFSGWIERSFRYSDEVLAHLMALCDPSTLLLVGTGLGQRPMDPDGEIHNPVVRAHEPEALFRAFGLQSFEVLHQMNPDLTVNFSDEEAAARAFTVLSSLAIVPGAPLFDATRAGLQVFLELRLPPEIWRNPTARIHSDASDAPGVPWQQFIKVSGHRDQSTAHHHDGGLLLAWSPSGSLEGTSEPIPVTDIAPNLLNLLGVPLAPWMNPTPVSILSQVGV